MKNIAIFLLSFGFLTLQGQQVLFNQSISEREVAENQRLNSELKSNYISTRYVVQADFISEQDFYIMLNPELVIKSNFRQMYYYPTGSFSYTGTVEGKFNGEVTFSKFQDRTSGLVVLGDGRKFVIDQQGQDLFAVSLVEDAVFKLLESGPDFVEAMPTGNSNGKIEAGSICDLANTCASPSTIDLMIVYSQLAETNWGGQANTVANITQAVTNMNTALTSSGVNNVTFRLVHTAKVTYTESGSFSTDLSRLANASDGYMDNVHTLRDQFGADMVSLIIGSPTSSCGIGYLNTSPTSYSASSGFNVSLYSCVVGNFTMSHEFGHNMGLRHDWYVDGSTTPCSHHHGYTNETAITQGASSSTNARWRTIMAYNDHCSSVGISCTRVNRWSNPLVTYNGEATGRAIGLTQPSDEAYAYYRMACLVAAFRPEASSCAVPGGLTSSAITGTTATLSWSSAPGAISYDADYKASSSAIWINAATATTSLSVNLSGLSPSTVYDWRVKSNCSSQTSAYASSQFTTVSPCPGPFDISTNGTTGGAATIALNTDIKGTIFPQNDNDYYKFVITTGGTITLTLTTLPANYELALLSSTGSQITRSQNGGTNNETINRTVTAGTYYARVYPKGSAKHATSCYTLRVQTGTAADEDVQAPFGLTVFPNPASNALNVLVNGSVAETKLTLFNLMGQLIMNQNAVDGTAVLDLSLLPAGCYMLNATDGNSSKSVRFIKE